ncbi:MAG: DinB family protein [Gemmatimonadota bacterium]
MSREILGSIETEYRRYKALAEGAMEQLDAEELCRSPVPPNNSIATIAWHVSGNLESRFTDFLDSDGEKPWRDRESEFEDRQVTREALLQKWERGWTIVLDALASLKDEDLHREVAIRSMPLAVHAALHRSLAHTSHHVGQIVYLARNYRGEGWRYLSIPPGGTASYNQKPTLEKG